MQEQKNYRLGKKPKEQIFLCTLYSKNQLKIEVSMFTNSATKDK